MPIQSHEKSAPENFQQFVSRIAVRPHANMLTRRRIGENPMRLRFHGVEGPYILFDVMNDDYERVGVGFIPMPASRLCNGIVFHFDHGGMTVYNGETRRGAWIDPIRIEYMEEGETA